MAGLAPAGADRAALRATYVENLRWAARAGRAGRRRRPDRADQHARHPGLLPQPPGRGARDRAPRSARRNLKVQMDLYHCQIVEGDVAMKLRAVPADRPRRPHPDRRRAGAARARHRRAELRVPVRRDRRARLRRLDRLRIPAGRPATSSGLGWLRRAEAAQRR